MEETYQLDGIFREFIMFVGCQGGNIVRRYSGNPFLLNYFTDYFPSVFDGN